LSTEESGQMNFSEHVAGAEKSQSRNRILVPAWISYGRSMLPDPRQGRGALVGFGVGLGVGSEVGSGVVGSTVGSGVTPTVGSGLAAASGIVAGAAVGDGTVAAEGW